MRALLLVPVLLLAGCVQLEAPPPPAPGGPSGSGDEATKGPAWSFTDTEGVTHGRDTPAGNATVLFFMASWCGTCRSKAPMLAKVHGDVAAGGVRFYSVSFDTTDDAASLRKWRDDFDNHWPHGVDGGFGIQRAFGVTQQSSVVVLDGDGVLVQKWGYGGVSEQALRDAIARAVA